MNGDEKQLLESIKDAVSEASADVKDLKHNLYGMPPSGKGDIGEIKECLSDGKVVHKDHESRIVRLETIVKITAGISGSGGALAGILKALHVY